MFKFAIEVCFEKHFGLIHALFAGIDKIRILFLGHLVDRLVYSIIHCMVQESKAEKSLEG